MHRAYMVVILVMLFGSDAAAGLESISNADAASGLRQALTEGSSAAVAQLGAQNGFLGNPKVKIPLPPALENIQGMLRVAGMGQQADDLVVAMNRAAEAAVPQARTLLVESVRKMTVQDAKGILTGGDTAATDYFRRTTQADLTQRFLPIVKRATDGAGLAAKYNALAGQANQFGLVSKEQSTIEGYVTGKALDGLYLMIAEQEKRFRQDPLGASSDIVRKVFGAMR